MPFDSFDYFAGEHEREQALPVEPNLLNESISSQPDDEQILISLISSRGSSVVGDTVADTIVKRTINTLLPDRQVDDDLIFGDQHTAKPSEPVARETPLPNTPDNSFCAALEHEITSLIASNNVEASTSEPSSTRELQTADAARTADEAEADDRQAAHHAKRVKVLEQAISEDVKACI